MKYVLVLFTVLFAFSLESASFASQVCYRDVYGKVDHVGIGTDTGGTHNVNDAYVSLSLVDGKDKNKDQLVTFYLDPRKPNEKEMLDLAKLALVTDKILVVGGQIEIEERCNSVSVVIPSRIKSVTGMAIFKKE